MRSFVCFRVGGVWRNPASLALITVLMATPNGFGAKPSNVDSTKLVSATVPKTTGSTTKDSIPKVAPSVGKAPPTATKTAAPTAPTIPQTPSATGASTGACLQCPAARIPVVAITDLQAHGISQGDAATITDALASNLQKTGKFRVMERSQMDQILKEQNFQQSGACDASQCAVEMGRILGLDRIVVGSMGLVGSTYSFNLRLVDVGTGEALRTTAGVHKGSIDEVLTDLVPAAVADLAGNKNGSGANGDAKKTAVWPWVVSGAVVVGGGVAALLLMNSSSNSSPATVATPANDPHVTFTW